MLNGCRVLSSKTDPARHCVCTVRHLAQAEQGLSQGGLKRFTAYTINVFNVSWKTLNYVNCYNYTIGVFYCSSEGTLVLILCAELVYDIICYYLSAET